MKKVSRILVFALALSFCSQLSFAGIVSWVKYERAGRYYLLIRTSAGGGVQADFFGGIIKKPATTPKPGMAAVSLIQADPHTWLVEAGSEKELMEYFALLQREGQF